MRCQATKIDGAQCSKQAWKNGLCNLHYQKAQAQQLLHACRAGDEPEEMTPEDIREEVTRMSRREIDWRVEFLTQMQRDALEYLCSLPGNENLDTRSRGAINRAVRRAGVRNRMELIALYTRWKTTEKGR